MGHDHKATHEVAGNLVRGSPLGGLDGLEKGLAQGWQGLWKEPQAPPLLCSLWKLQTVGDALCGL